MKLGICTSDYPVQSLDSLCDSIEQVGFSQVQFSFETIGEEELPAIIKLDQIKQINRAFEARDLEMTAINGTFNAIDPDLNRREEGIKRFAVMAEACDSLNCKILTICTGTRNPQGMWQDHPDNASEQAWRDMIKTVYALAEIAEKHQIFLGVETEASNVVSTPKLARRLLDEINSPRLKIIMDCANLFHKGKAVPDNVRPTISSAFDYLGHDIILAHGKDIYASEGIDFATPGKGILDYPYFLKLLEQYNYQGGMILHGCETPEDIPAAADFMRRCITF